jgi:hypothetical protein
MDGQSLKRKGISLSKESKPQLRSRSPAFLTVMQKGKRPLVVERREIKLLLKARDD